MLESIGTGFVVPFNRVSVAHRNSLPDLICELPICPNGFIGFLMRVMAAVLAIGMPQLLLQLDPFSTCFPWGSRPLIFRE